MKGVLTLQGDALSQAVSPWPLSPSHITGEATRGACRGLLLISALPLAGCIALGSILDLFGPQFPRLQNDNNPQPPPGISVWLQGGAGRGCFAHSLAQSGPSEAWAVTGLGWPQIKVELAYI